MNEFFKKYIETFTILSAIFSSFLWLNNKFNTLEKELLIVKNEVEIVKTVLIIQKIMPAELAVK